MEIFQLSLQQPLNLHKLATAQLLQHHCPHVSRNLSNCKAQEAPPWIHETIPTILRPHLLLLWSSDMNIDPFIYYWWINTPIMYTIITITIMMMLYDMMCNELCMTMYILCTVMYLFLECFHNIFTEQFRTKPLWIKIKQNCHYFNEESSQWYTVGFWF